MPLLLTARFHTTVAALPQLPRDGLLEVAFVGRSNAGKSSAINVLCNRRRLAFSSRTPGRTQALNYFAVGPVDRPVAYLVDTPGYGYASAPLETKRGWDQLAGQYLQDRPQLAGVVLLVDIRRQLTDLDRRLIGWVPPGVRLALVLTKSDKLGRQVGRQAMVDVRAEIERIRPGAENLTLQFSALNRSGSDELARLVENWLETGLPATPARTVPAAGPAAEKKPRRP
jgi:GTP-binding protein